MKNRTLLLAVGCLLLFAAVAFAQYDWLMANGNRELSAFAKNEKILKPPFAIINDLPIAVEYMAIDGRFLGVIRTRDPLSNIAEMVDLSSAAILWSFEIPDTKGSAGMIPALSDSLLFCSGQNSTSFYALERNTGAVRWQKTFTDDIYQKHPIVDGPRLYFIHDSLFCFEAATGKVLWKQRLNLSQMTPAVDDSTVYAVSRPLSGKLCWAFNKFTGEQKWQVENDGYYLLTVDRRYVYTHNGQTVVARDKKTGAIAHTYTLPPNYITLAFSPARAPCRMTTCAFV